MILLMFVFVNSVRQSDRFTKKPKTVRYDEYEQIPFVPMELIPIGKPQFEDFVLKSESELTSGTYFEPGDVLVAKITPSFENGKQGIIEQLPTPFGIATTEVIPIQEIQGISNKFFIFYYLLLPTIRKNLAAKMEGTTGRQRLKPTMIKKLEIPLPPAEQQEEIVNILRACDDKIAALEKEVATLNELFQTLLEQLMTGQLAAQPPVALTKLLT